MEVGGTLSVGKKKKTKNISRKNDDKKARRRASKGNKKDTGKQVKMPVKG